MLGGAADGVIRALHQLTVSIGAPCGAGIARAAVCHVVLGTQNEDSLHPAGHTRSERVHRTLQSQLSGRGPQCASLRVDRRATSAPCGCRS